MDIFEKVLSRSLKSPQNGDSKEVGGIGGIIFKSIDEAIEKSIKKHVETAKKEMEKMVKDVEASLKDVESSLPNINQLKFEISSSIADKIPNYDKLKREISSSVMRSIPPAPVQTVERIVEKAAPPQIIKEVEKVDLSKYVPIEHFEEVTKKLSDLYSRIGEQEKAGPVFVPAPPIIPSWSNESGKYLTNNGDQLKWAAAQSGADGYLTLGDGTSDGSWRIYVNGNDLSVQRLESGTWTEKGAFVA